MAKGISIGVGADTRGFQQGIRTGVLKPLEGVEDALQDVGREGEQAGDDLVQGMRHAQRETERLEDANKDLADTIRREARQAKRAVQDLGDDGFHRASENVEGFKDEAKQNFAEVAASFDGSIQGMADGVQGLTGGLATALTPGIGIPVAILGAAAGAFLAQWQASTEQAEQRVADMYNDMLESGQAFLSEDFIQRELAKIGEGADDAAISFEDAGRQAKEFGLSQQTIMRAYAGDQEAINTVIAEAVKQRDAELDRINDAALSSHDRLEAQDEINAKYDESINKLRGISKGTQDAASKAAIVASAYATGNANLDKQLGKVRDLAAKIDKLGTGKSIRLDVIPDMREFNKQIGLQQGRSVTVNVKGQITKIGNQVW